MVQDTPSPHDTSAGGPAAAIARACVGAGSTVQVAGKILGRAVLIPSH